MRSPMTGTESPDCKLTNRSGDPTHSRGTLGREWPDPILAVASVAGQNVPDGASRS